jgi:hypothetical protein
MFLVRVSSGVPRQHSNFSSLTLPAEMAKVFRNLQEGEYRRVHRASDISEMLRTVGWCY